MALGRRPLLSARCNTLPRRFWRPLVGIAAASVVLGLSPSGAAAYLARPMVGLGGPLAGLPAGPITTVAEARAAISALNVRLDRLTEAYDQAGVLLHRDRRLVRSSRRQLASARARVAASRARIDEFAATAYQEGAPQPLAGLLATGSPQAFLDAQAQLGAASSAQVTALRELVRSEQALRSAHRRLASRLTRQVRLVGRLGRDRQAILGALAVENATLQRLTAPVRAVVTAPPPPPPAPPPPPPAPVLAAVSGGATAAVQFAYAQLGKPYQWGAAGPDSYDCSGLTMASWAAGGVSLPHSAAMQQASVPAVPLSSLQPGDLVFFGNPAYHVGIYVGHGDMIEAPYQGLDVRVTSITNEPGLSGAGRP
jgi:cell wall-associated NlpC family hydrolase